MITAPTAKAITMPDKPFPPLELAELDVEFEALFEVEPFDQLRSKQKYSAVKIFLQLSETIPSGRCIQIADY